MFISTYTLLHLPVMVNVEEKRPKCTLSIGIVGMCLHVCVHEWMHIFHIVCVYICVYVCVCIHVMYMRIILIRVHDYILQHAATHSTNTRENMHTHV